MLTDIIPASSRKVVYAIFAVIGFVVGQIGVGFVIGQVVPPLWYLITAAVVSNLGVAIGATAASNINAASPGAAAPAPARAVGPSTTVANGVATFDPGNGGPTTSTPI